ncbi:MAG TPA: hypothetical protein VFQ35_29115 [Polyangiaceae bacterium]|nr:hypothetical protein [Polyangiaceae bacterium]
MKEWCKPVLLGLPFLLLSCEKESPRSDAPKAAASSGEKATALDPDLAQAMAAASAAAPAQPGTAAAGGPPATGIFAPGAADREVKKGDPPKLTLGNEGKEPRITLTPVQPKPGSKQSGIISVVQQQADGSGIPIEFAVTFEAQKPKADAAPTAPVPVTVKVTGAKIAVAGAPKDLEATVAKLKGSKIDYEVAADGAGSNYRFELSKAAPADLGDTIRSLSDVIAVVTVPFPDKPVGAEGFWMATSREGVLGLDLVTYRLIKVERIDGQKVTLNVNTKRYSATPNFDLPGLQPGAPHSLAEFQALAQGTVELVAGKGFPVGGNQNSSLRAQLQDPANPRARGMLQIDTQAELKF